MVAGFRQIGPDGRVATGTMTLKRPGKVRFDYGKGSNLLVVADGRRLSFIDYRVSQVSQWPLRETPLAVLLDPAADWSRIARVLPAAETPVPGAVAVEAMDPKRPDIGRIVVLLKPDSGAPGGYALLGWRALDSQGARTIVELSDVRWNVGVADSAFRFRDPRPRVTPGRPS
jgi:outer membrane lipoprotein-sorting protein